MFRAILEGRCKKGLNLLPHFYRFRLGTYEYFVFKDFHPILEGRCKKGLNLLPHFYRFRLGTYEYFVFKDFHPLASVSASVF